MGRASKPDGQVRPSTRKVHGLLSDVRQEGFRPLVRRRGYGGGRVLRGPRGSGCPREGLRRGRCRLCRRRGRRGRRGILSVNKTQDNETKHATKSQTDV